MLRLIREVSRAEDDGCTADGWRRKTSSLHLLIITIMTHPVAMAALRQKKAHEGELDRIAGTRLTLETQVSCSF